MTDTAALLTQVSKRPNSAIAVSAMRATASSRATSAGTVHSHVPSLSPIAG